MNKKNIVVIGGGTGNFTVLRGLKKYPVKLSAIVAMMDSGGSTGKLRTELGVLPPGDARQCLIALSHSSFKTLELFNYRFTHGCLKGHNFGNLLIAALEKTTGNFENAVKEAGNFLKLGGKVIPVTSKQTHICVKPEKGRVVKGEHFISNEPTKELIKYDIVKAYLEPKVKATAEALKAIKKADLIVLSPGNFYSSIIANLLVGGVAKAIKKSKAKKVFVVNMMNRLAQTDHFKLSDYIKTMEEYLGKNVLEYIIYNKEKPASRLLKIYAKDREVYVEDDIEGKEYNGYKIIRANLLSKKTFRQIKGDPLKRSLIRHDSSKLAYHINNCLNGK